MRHHLFADQTTEPYPVAILQKSNSFLKTDLVTHYVNPMVQLGVPASEIIAFSLAYNDNGKAPASFIKEYLSTLLKALEHLEVRYLYVTDAAYFKVLAGVAKAEPHFGYALPCKVKGYEHFQVFLGINHQQLFYNPALIDRMNLSLSAVSSSFLGSYQEPGKGIIHSAQYPKTFQEIAEALKSLHQYPRLSCDIEGFSLRFNEAGIGTIAFAWDEHNGIAFACDYIEQPDTDDPSIKGIKTDNWCVRKLLKEFFESYQGELVFHHAPYDVKAIVASLWMDNLLDREGMMHGLRVMWDKLHDTKIIAYLATNSTAGNQLSLKTLAHEFAGNWAVEVKDIRKVPLDKLLEYNLVDALCTNYVYDKYVPIMEADNQGDLYRGLFLDSLKLIIQMEMVGMPMSRTRVLEVKTELEGIQQTQLDLITNHPHVIALNLMLQQTAMETANAKLKKKQHPLEHFKDLVFNPNSGPQLQRLLYERMGLPVVDKTDTGEPATGGETLDKLLNHVQASDKELIEALITYSSITKILSTFIPAFEEGVSKDGSDTIWLHGSFNLGGTVSGRLSSSDPNLQNLPAGNTGTDLKQHLGKLVKSCFVAPDDWLFCGADFNSLEDYISALTTKDPNKLDVYIKKFDGHCLRAAYYFRDELPHIDLDDPASVNSIKKTHPELRQKSKVPTFALTYAGTYITLMNNLGWPEDEAKKVEKNYHELYKVSDQYVQDRLQQASKDGYVEVAFGLRVRTPLLKQVVWGGSKMPHEASAEGRTAGNALGQSYGLLNNRAAVAFIKKVWDSPYRYSIFPVALVHDAIYVLVLDDVDALEFANRELINEMRWQELPEIEHPTVKLGAALDVFWPNWTNPITLPNEATKDTLYDVCRRSQQEWLTTQ